MVPRGQGGSSVRREICLAFHPRTTQTASVTAWISRTAPRRNCGPPPISWPTRSGSPTSEAGNGAWPNDEVFWSDQLYRIFGLEPRRDPTPFRATLRYISGAGPPRRAARGPGQDREPPSARPCRSASSTASCARTATAADRPLPGRAGYRSRYPGDRAVVGVCQDVTEIATDRACALRGRRSLSQCLRERARSASRSLTFQRGPGRSADRGEPRPVRPHGPAAPRS